MKQRPSNTNTSTRSRRAIEDNLRLSRAILHCANRGLPRTEFLGIVSKLILDFSGCDAVEVRLNDGDLHYRWEATRRPESTVRFEPVRWTIRDGGRVIPAAREPADLEQLCNDVACQNFDAALPFFTSNGSFWTGDTWAPLSYRPVTEKATDTEDLCIGGHYRSLALIRFFVNIDTVGLLQIKSQQQNWFAEDDVQVYEGVAQTLGLAVADRRAHAAHGCNAQG